MPLINTAELDPQRLYKLLVTSVEPRPIAFVATVGEDGTPNLAPFSFFTVASVNPPVLAFNVMRRPLPDGSELKDTIRNLEQHPECVVHIVPYELREKMNLTSADWPYGANEFEVSGLTPAPSDLVEVPRVAEAPVAFECTVEQIMRFGEGPFAGNLVLARVLMAHVDDQVWSEEMIQRALLDPIGRLGGPFYVRVRDAVFKMPQPGKDVVEQVLGAQVSPS